MAKLSVKKGSTSRIEYIFVGDSTSATGTGLTGLTYQSSGLLSHYIRPAGSATTITLATQTVTGSYSSGGFVEVDQTRMPGLYRFDIPNAVFASGSSSAILQISNISTGDKAIIIYKFQYIRYSFFHISIC